MDNVKTSTISSRLERCVSDCEKTVILHALKRAEGDAVVAARMLGTKKRVLARKILKYEIDCTQFESR